MPSRMKTTQCQQGFPFSNRHFTDNKAQFGSEGQSVNGTSLSLIWMFNTDSNLRMQPVSDHRAEFSADMPSPLAICLASSYEIPAIAAELAIAHPVVSF